jgi:hypothetical protein
MRNRHRPSLVTVAAILTAAAGSTALAQCPPTFTVSGPWPMGSPGMPVVGDFDHDGKLDLASPNFNGQDVTVRFANVNQPAGVLYDQAISFTLGFNPSTAAAADFNNDGVTDLAVAFLNGGAPRIAVFISNGNRTFQPAALYAPSPSTTNIQAADITRDGIPDIVGFTTTGITVLPGGPGPWTSGGAAAFSFRPLTTTGAGGMTLVDLNNDGALDVAMGQSDPGRVRVALGSPPASATFSEPVAYGAGFFGTGTPARGDFNGDGRADLVVTHSVSGNRVQVFLSNPDGSLAPQTAVFAGGASAFVSTTGDFNGDGLLDAATTHSTGVGVHRGNGAGGLTNATNFAVTQPNGVATADMNNDGRPDLIVSSQAQGAFTILLNTTPVSSYTTQPLNKRVCPGGGSSAQFTAAATTTQTGGITGYRWQRQAGGVWTDLTDGPLAGVGTVSGSLTQVMTVSGVQGNPGDTVAQLRATALTTCGAFPSNAVTLSLIVPCGGADIGATGGVASPCGDGVLDNNDFVVFIDHFFNGNVIADVGSVGGVPGADGHFDNNDFVVFIDMFFGGCTI